VRAAPFILLLLLTPPAFSEAPRPVPKLAVWMEVSANLPTFASREQTALVLDRAKAAGVTDIIPEAKNAWGFVLYESTFAPHIRTSPVTQAQPIGGLLGTPSQFSSRRAASHES